MGIGGVMVEIGPKLHTFERIRTIVTIVKHCESVFDLVCAKIKYNFHAPFNTFEIMKQLIWVWFYSTHYFHIYKIDNLL